MRSNRTQSFNNRLDAYVTGFFLSLVAGIFLISLREWILIAARQKDAEFYFVSYPAEELLKKIRFVSRYYGGGRGEAVGGERLALVQPEPALSRR